MFKAVLVNYNYNPTWLHDYKFDVTLYDRSDEPFNPADFPTAKVIKTPNIGNVDYDKLGYLIDNYDNLPDRFLWGKSNLFKYITKKEFDTALKNPGFTPLLTQEHRTYVDDQGEVCYYVGGMYYERNTSWYLNSHHAKYFPSWREWAIEFGLPHDIRYIPFPPGGNFILTKDVVRKYSKDFYERMRETMGYTQLPGEAQLAERSYYLLWS